MLTRASTVIGIPVFTIRTGKKIQEIKEVIYHPGQNRIAAFIVDKGSWFSGAQIIVFEDIVVLGEDAVLVDSAAVLKKASEVQQDIESITKSHTYLTDTRIITEKGEELGRVSDIFFDNKSGMVEEFEVSKNGTKNSKSEKKRVKISDIVTIGEDVAIVRVQSETDQDNLKKIQEEVKNKISDLNVRIYGQQEMSGQAGGIQTSEAQSRTSDTTRKVNERRKKEAVGLYLTKNILTIDDILLAKEGDMVTNKLLDTAEEKGVLEQVLNNFSTRIPISA